MIRNELSKAHKQGLIYPRIFVISLYQNHAIWVEKRIVK
jgi:hypothetical protein